MSRIFASPLLWLMVLLMFLTFFYYDRDFSEVKSSYVKQRMRLIRVHFSELDGPFESVRVFANVVDMDDNQSNMLASSVKAIFYNREIATRTSLLVSLNATKNPFESRFWGNVKIRSTDLEKLDCNELRYFPSRKEIFTQDPVRIVRGSAIITGVELRMNTETKTGTLDRNIRIEVYPASLTATAPAAAIRLPDFAAPQHDIGRIASLASTVASTTNASATGASTTVAMASGPASIPATVRSASGTPPVTIGPGTATAAAGFAPLSPQTDRWAGIRVFPSLAPLLDRPRPPKTGRPVPTASPSAGLPRVTSNTVPLPAAPWPPATARIASLPTRLPIRSRPAATTTAVLPRIGSSSTRPAAPGGLNHGP